MSAASSTLEGCLTRKDSDEASRARQESSLNPRLRCGRCRKHKEKLAVKNNGVDAQKRSPIEPVQVDCHADENANI